VNQTSSNIAGFNLNELSEEHLGNDSERVLSLSPDQCYCEKQIRTVFDDHEIYELSESLKNTWQQQAIVVHPVDEDGLYKIDKGERRWRAAQMIEGFKLKAIVDFEAPLRDRKHQLLGQLVENDSRVDLPGIDMAYALTELIDLGYTREEVAFKLGWVSESDKPNINKVTRFLSLLKLPEDGISLLKDNIVTDLITLEVIRKLHELNNDKFIELCDQSRINNGLSRKDAENQLKEVKDELKRISEEKSQQNISELDSKEKSQQNISELDSEEKSSQNNSELDDEIQPPETNENTSQHNNSNDVNKSESNQQILPEVITSAEVKVECHDGRKGILVLNKKPEHSDEVFVSFNQDEMSLVKLNELKLHSLEFY